MSLSPSPWSVSEKRVYVKDANGENVCAVSRHDDCALIAAAPDLLAAVKALRDAAYGNPWHPFDTERTDELADQAIAKAEGR